jgi:hypothetical protein
MYFISSRMAERGGGGWYFSSVATLGNEAWWKVMKCYTWSRVRKDTGGWRFVSFYSLPNINWGRTNQVGWERLGQAARIRVM